LGNVYAKLRRSGGATSYTLPDRPIQFATQPSSSCNGFCAACATAVETGPETFKAAAASADWSRSLYQFLTNEPVQDAWPVVGATFALLHASQDQPDRSAALLKFFDWVFANGGRAAEDMDHIPLPTPPDCRVWHQARRPCTRACQASLR
jgi:hypothetical protein